MTHVRLRVGLVLLGAPQLFIGIWARVSPRSWYGHFPGFGHHWITATGPYNNHLIEDFGAATIALAVLALLAAWWPQQRVVTVAMITWLCFSVPHFVAHVRERDMMSSTDYALVLVSVGLTVALPAVVLWLNYSRTVTAKTADI